MKMKAPLLFFFVFTLLEKPARAEVKRDLLLQHESGADSIQNTNGAYGSINFMNLTSYLAFLDDIFNHLGSSHNISKKCRFDTSVLQQRASNGDSNALRILDSAGKPSSGILEGGVYFIGFYSECVTSFVNISHSEKFGGQYCLINFNFTENQQKPIPNALWQVIAQSKKPPTIGICIPSSCSASDLNHATSLSLNESFGAITGDVSVCHTNPSGFHKDTGAIIIFVILVGFAFLVCTATVVEIVRDRRALSAAATSNAKSTSREVLCEVTEVRTKRNVPLECLLAFSGKRNWKKIMTVNQGREGVSCVHGLKFYSMALIMLGHTFSFAALYMFFRNPGAANDAPKRFVSQIFANGTLAVDTFYFISGLLVAYVTLKVLDKTNGKMNILLFYFHRYFRLTPLLLMVVLISGFLVRYLGSGPNWMASILMYDEWCKENWYLNALYLHNFIHTENMCLSHSWYLATDMQFYLVVPAILIPLHRNVKYGAIAAFVFLFITTLTTAVLTAVNHYPAIPYINNIVPQSIVDSYYKNIYIKPYCRMGPYIIGILVGYILLHKKDFILKKTTCIMLWTVSVILGLSIIYLMWPANLGHIPTDSQAAAYSSLARTLWGVCIGWLVIACHYGYAGFINDILSWPPLVPLSRLTYCAYLIHPVVMNIHYGSTQNLVDFSQGFMLYLFFGNICITFILAIPLSLMFESPFVALERVILSR